jgi:hypothetical protein
MCLNCCLYTCEILRLQACQRWCICLPDLAIAEESPEGYSSAPSLELQFFLIGVYEPVATVTSLHFVKYHDLVEVS